MSEILGIRDADTARNINGENGVGDIALDRFEDSITLGARGYSGWDHFVMKLLGGVAFYSVYGLMTPGLDQHCG